MAFRGTLTLKYGMLLNDTAMLVVNIVAITLNTIYTIFFYQYARDKYEEVLKPLGIGTALIAVFLGYAQIESAQNIEYRYGLILTILMLLLLGAPLLDIVSDAKFQLCQYQYLNARILFYLIFRKR